MPANMPVWFGIVFGPIARSLITLVMAWLVEKKVYDGTTSSAIISSFVAAAPAALWGIIVQIRNRWWLHTAAAMQPATVQQIKEQVRAGNAPPVSVPENRVPYLEGHKPERYSTDAPGAPAVVDDPLGPMPMPHSDESPSKK